MYITDIVINDKNENIEKALNRHKEQIKKIDKKLDSLLNIINEKGEIEIYNSIDELPTTGKENILYICEVENKIYRWDDTNIKYYCVGSNYDEIKEIYCGGSK